VIGNVVIITHTPLPPAFLGCLPDEPGFTGYHWYSSSSLALEENLPEWV